MRKWKVSGLNDSVQTRQLVNAELWFTYQSFGSKSVVVALDLVIFHSRSEDQALYFLDQCFSVLVVFHLCSM